MATDYSVMRPRLSTAATGVLCAIWLMEWTLWQHPPTSAASPIVYGTFIVRVVLLSGLGVLAVLAGRRWSAPLVPLLSGVVASLGVYLVGILTGQFMARGIGPAIVIASFVTQVAVAVLAASVGAGVGLWLVRSRGKAASSAI